MFDFNKIIVGNQELIGHYFYNNKFVLGTSYNSKGELVDIVFEIVK